MEWVTGHGLRASWGADLVNEHKPRVVKDGWRRFCLSIGLRDDGVDDTLQHPAHVRLRE